MRRRIRRRRDGLLEIRPLSWRDVGLARDLGIMSGLALAWGACTVAVVAALVTSPLVVAAGVIAVGLLFAPADVRAPASREGGRTPPPGWAA